MASAKLTSVNAAKLAELFETATRVRPFFIGLLIFLHQQSRNVYVSKAWLTSLWCSFVLRIAETKFDFGDGPPELLFKSAELSSRPRDERMLRCCYTPLLLMHRNALDVKSAIKSLYFSFFCKVPSLVLPFCFWSRTYCEPPLFFFEGCFHDWHCLVYFYRYFSFSCISICIIICICIQPIGCLEPHTPIYSDVLQIYSIIKRNCTKLRSVGPLLATSGLHADYNRWCLTLAWTSFTDSIFLFSGNRSPTHMAMRTCPSRWLWL